MRRPMTAPAPLPIPRAVLVNAVRLLGIDPEQTDHVILTPDSATWRDINGDSHAIEVKA